MRLYYGLLVAAMAAVVLAGDALAFLIAWEVMALSAFFLVSTEEHKREAREAGWLYLVATHVGTLFLLAMFGLLRVASGSFELQPLGAGVGLGGEQHRDEIGRRPPVDHAVMGLVDEREAIAFDAFNEPQFPERPAAVELL